MNHKQMTNYIQETVIPDIINIREEGQKEYASCNGKNNNVFANFDRISELLNISSEKVIVTYLMKHIEGIVSWVNGHKSQREPVDGRINDAINYLILLRGKIHNKGE